MGEIRLSITAERRECDTCLNANFTREDTGIPQYPCAIYALTIGEGYRQPSHLCPNCLNYLRVTLGVKNQHAVTQTAPDANASPARFRVLPTTALCNTEGE